MKASFIDRLPHFAVEFILSAVTLYGYPYGSKESDIERMRNANFAQRDSQKAGKNTGVDKVRENTKTKVDHADSVD